MHIVFFCVCLRFVSFHSINYEKKKEAMNSVFNCFLGNVLFKEHVLVSSLWYFVICSKHSPLLERERCFFQYLIYFDPLLVPHSYS